MVSIFQRPPHISQPLSSSFAEVPVRSETELLNAIGSIAARGALGVLASVGGSILICAPITITAPIIIPESCPGLSIRAAAKFPIFPASAGISTLFDVRAELFTAEGLFVFVKADAAGNATTWFTTFVTITGGASSGRSRTKPALINNDVFVDRLYVDGSAGLADNAEIVGNRQGNATTTSSAAVVAVDSVGAHVGLNTLHLSAGSQDAINVGANGSRASIVGNDCGNQNITTSASSGGNRLAGNTQVGTKTLAASDIDESNLPGRLLRTPQVLTAGTSYTKPAGCNSIVVELVGGGGGGGGCSSAASSGACGGGGASGAYASKRYDLSALAGPFTYAIGGAGTAGTNAGGTGGNGGDTTFTDGTTLVTAKGGLGGVGEAAATTAAFVAGGAGQLSTNGDLNGAGSPGEYAQRLSGTAAVSGGGGSSEWGGGGLARTAAGAGNAGAGIGAGGGGALVLSASAAAIGGAGTAGAIRVWEYS